MCGRSRGTAMAGRRNSPGGMGSTLAEIQALLGHKSAVETWDTYGHLMGDEDTHSRAVVDAALGGRCRSGSDGKRRQVVVSVCVFVQKEW